MPRLNLLSDSSSNVAILRTWPHARTVHQRTYPRGTLPSHHRLLEALCPLRCSLTSRDHETLTWAQIKGLCK